MESDCLKSISRKTKIHQIQLFIIHMNKMMTVVGIRLPHGHAPISYTCRLNQLTALWYIDIYVKKAPLFYHNVKTHSIQVILEQYLII